MRTEQGMVCPQVPSAMTCPTALPSQPLLTGEFGPPSPRHCHSQTRRHRRTSLRSSLGLQTQQREGDFWSSSTGHCRSRCQEGEEDRQLFHPERAVAPVSAAHTETVGKPGASCCCSGRTGVCMPHGYDQYIQSERTMAWKHALSG